jgi:hypothetical protein
VNDSALHGGRWACHHDRDDEDQVRRMDHKATICGVTSLRLILSDHDAGRATAGTTTTAKCSLHHTRVIRPRGLETRGPGT